jgi:hypothetical protein
MAPRHATVRARRRAPRWTRHLASWIVVLGAMSAAPCRRAPPTAGDDLPAPAPPRAQPTGPAARRPLLRAVIGLGVER